MEWSSRAAMKAFLNTLHLCEVKKQESSPESTSPLIEPQSTELISALAAGNQAKLMVEITTQGITSLTIALVVAAKQTGGHVICIVPHHHNNIDHHKTIQDQLKHYNNIIADLNKVMKLVIGDPCEVIKHYKKIDFAVIDGKFEDHLSLFKCIDINVKGSVVVVNSKFCRRSFGEIIKGRRGVESMVSLPVGEGMELTRIGSSSSSGRLLGNKKKSRRFYVVDEYHC